MQKIAELTPVHLLIHEMEFLTPTSQRPNVPIASLLAEATVSA
jgi:hypothetical protein